MLLYTILAVGAAPVETNPSVDVAIVVWTHRKQRLSAAELKTGAKTIPTWLEQQRKCKTCGAAKDKNGCTQCLKCSWNLNIMGSYECRGDFGRTMGRKHAATPLNRFNLRTRIAKKQL